MADDPAAEPDGDFLAALAAVADDPALDPAFKALALGLPPEEEVIAHMAAAGLTPDPLAIWGARRRLEAAAARALSGRLRALYDGNAVPGPYSPDAGGRRPPGAARAGAGAADGARSRRGGCARASSRAAGNMTERMAALALLVAYGQAEEALAEFHAAWAHDRLVIDKWFSVQAARHPARRGGRHGRGADAASGLRLEEPQPVPGADRRLRHRATRPASTPPTAAATGWWWTG